MNISHVCAVICRQACDGSNYRLSRLSCSTKYLLNKTYRTENVLLFIWCMSYLPMSTHGRFDVFLIGHVYHSRNVSRRGEVGMGSPAPFSLYVKNIPTAIHHDNLAVCMNCTSLSATSHKPLLLVRYLRGFDSLGKRRPSESRRTLRCPLV